MNSDNNYYVLKSAISFEAGDELTVYLYASGSTQSYLVGSNKKEVTEKNDAGSVYPLEYTLISIFFSLINDLKLS